MDNLNQLRQSLMEYLRTNHISFCHTLDDGMKDRAVVEFSFDFEKKPCIHFGSFDDKVREVVSIAHEAGHVIIYQKMKTEEVMNYLCTMFASQWIGLNNVSSSGQECMLMVEARASEQGLSVLDEIGMLDNDLKKVAEIMKKWYRTYETLCLKKVVEKVRMHVLIKNRADSWNMVID